MVLNNRTSPFFAVNIDIPEGKYVNILVDETLYDAPLSRVKIPFLGVAIFNVNNFSSGYCNTGTDNLGVVFDADGNVLRRWQGASVNLSDAKWLLWSNNNNQSAANCYFTV